LDKFAVLAGVDLRDLVCEAFGVLFGQHLKIHEFLFQLGDLFFVQLDFVSDFAN
jgi:hypothetical protein